MQIQKECPHPSSQQPMQTETEKRGRKTNFKKTFNRLYDCYPSNIGQHEYRLRISGVDPGHVCTDPGICTTDYPDPAYFFVNDKKS